MSRSAIPARAPYGEVFPGAVVRHHGRIILTANPAPERDVLARGVVIRYGVRYLEKHFLSVVPGLIALERGETVHRRRRARLPRQAQQLVSPHRSVRLPQRRR
ncbi:MAG: hypothetical protein HND48_22750 [Chloroflexi bacterium]|nr:hypothetical protein [Chloroflexota bacterium]